MVSLRGLDKSTSLIYFLLKFNWFSCLMLWIFCLSGDWEKVSQVFTKNMGSSRSIKAYERVRWLESCLLLIYLTTTLYASRDTTFVDLFLEDGSSSLYFTFVLRKFASHYLGNLVMGVIDEKCIRLSYLLVFQVWDQLSQANLPLLC